jgi:glycosyltransferase involved in cell wall biosynthesis
VPDIAFMVQRLGPYHHARLSAFSKRVGTGLTVVEFRPEDAVYSWDEVRDHGGYTRIQTRSGTEICRALENIRPEVIVCVGYADPEIHAAAAWAMGRRLPLVTCSDSTYDDDPRSGIRETLKKRVLAAFDSALVAGQMSRAYIGTLGIDDRCCFAPWDVVDNGHFERGAELARARSDSERSRLGLPRHYFLCVSRFVPKKNLPTLIEAYARYAETTGSSAWNLVLIGSGPLETELRSLAASREVTDRVQFPGFLQYADLPAYYGLADALVLPSASDQWGLVVNEAMASGLPVLVSSRCGCAPDLVLEAENGHTIVPGDITSLQMAMVRQSQYDRRKSEQMGMRSREIISAYTPGAFASGLESAVASALARSSVRKPAYVRLLLRLLAKRADHTQ